MTKMPISGNMVAVRHSLIAHLYQADHWNQSSQNRSHPTAR